MTATKKGGGEELTRCSNIIIRKRIPPPIATIPMHHPRKLIRRRRLIKTPHIPLRLNPINKQRTPIKARRNPRTKRPHRNSITQIPPKRAGRARKDISSRGLSERSNPRESEEATLDYPGLQSPLRLRVDYERGAAVFLPDGGDVGVVVAGEEGGVHDVSRVGT